jgi:phage-related protein
LLLVVAPVLPQSDHSSVVKTPDNASPFEGSTGSNIMKLVERHDTNTFRCVFVAKFEKAVFVLHVFKKSTRGIATPQREIETVQARFRRAQELYAEEFGSPSTDDKRKRGR